MIILSCSSSMQEAGKRRDFEAKLNREAGGSPVWAGGAESLKKELVRLRRLTQDSEPENGGTG